MALILRLVASIIVTAICLWPYWVYKLVEGVLQPVGFWQKLVMLIGGFYFLGGMQLLFGIFWLGCLFYIWVGSGE